MDLKITSGNLELIACGSARTAFENKLKFDFGEVWLEFVFSKADGDSDARYDVSDDSHGMTCHVDVKGSTFGVAKPIELGDVDDRYFYMSYEVHRPSSKYECWVLNYSFYLGDNINE